MFTAEPFQQLADDEDVLAQLLIRDQRQLFVSSQHAEDMGPSACELLLRPAESLLQPGEFALDIALR